MKSETEIRERLAETAESLDKAMRASDDCEKRVLVVPETQYHALGGLTDETYTTRTGALFKLFRTRIQAKRRENGVLDDE
ncbi:MAG: hypothetical protein HQRvContig01_9 [Haloquadratum phage sp.]|jgi:hypothetical protein|nr:MAG: hypothetical protein HQRvContig01_9 [Haloquadratum phage sp.]